MSLPITSLFAGFVGILAVALAFVTVIHRVRSGHSWGDGGDERLHRTVRAHAHFIEFAPIFVLLLALAELTHATSETTLIALAATFAASRVLYLLYSFGAQKLPLRIAGFWTSALPIAGAAVALVL